MNEIKKDKFSDELINNLKDASLGHNYFNIRVKHADIASGGGDGDMLKADYDPDHDNIVERADHADTADSANTANNAQTLQGKNPSDFASANHNHNLSDLADVDNTDKADGKVLQWNEAAGKHIYVVNEGFEYFIYPEKFGATGNGVDNDVDAFNQMINYINNLSSPVMILLSKPYFIGGALNTIYFNKPLCMRGCGIDVTKLIFASDLDGINLDKKTDDDLPAPCTVEKFSLLTRGQSTGQAITVHQANPWNKTKFTVDNIFVGGENDPGIDGWNRGVVLNDIGNVHITNSFFENYTDNKAYSIYFYGSEQATNKDGAPYIPTLFNVTDCNFLYGAVGVGGSGHIEGVYIKGCNFVATNYGVYILNNSNTPSIPQFNIINNHIAFSITGIVLNNVSQSCIFHNLFYSRDDATGTLVCVYLNNSIINRIGDNIFVKINANQSFNGIVAASGSNHLQIGSNTFQSAGGAYTGIWLQQGAGSNIIVPAQNENIFVGDGINYLVDQR